jgi:putative ABC transport system substrate-binding protein
MRTERRRLLVASAALSLVLPGALRAQSASRVYRIAILDEASEKARAREWAAFRERLRELGLIEGKNAIYETRFARGQHERLSALAAELVAAKPDVIVCPNTPTARAAIRATATIPIVFIGPGDPAGTGLVASLSRPGGNATGFSATSPEVFVKSLELLRELSPGLQRVAFMSDVSNPAVIVTYSRLEENARKLKLAIQLLDGGGEVGLERSYAAIRRDRVQGLLVGTAGTVLNYRDQIVQFAAREKLLVVYGRREYVDAGGLLSYGIDRIPLSIRVADLVHRILHGAKPAEIPVEQIATVRMVLNLKTARALGVTVPASVRLRADEVIE